MVRYTGKFVNQGFRDTGIQLYVFKQGFRTWQHKTTAHIVFVIEELCAAARFRALIFSYVRKNFVRGSKSRLTYEKSYSKLLDDSLFILILF